jgi:hypothetical protein
MKHPKWTRRIFLGFAPILVGIGFANATPGETPGETPCGVVLKVGKGVQLIPTHGSVQNDFTEATPVSCASMIITHQETFWIRLSDQTVIKIAPQSFVEISKADAKTFHLYRGEVLVSAPPGISEQTWSTPNAETLFKGGMSLIHYQASERVTTVSSFNREVEFRNKFNPAATATVRVGEMSHLAIQEASVNPSQPAVMNHATVTQVLANLKLDSAEQTELSEVVKHVYEDRAKSLASEIADWDAVPEEDKKDEKPSRSIASVKGIAAPEKALDPKEANFVTQMMREHLYGSNEDQKNVESNRKPASAEKPMAIDDTEMQNHKKSLKLENKKLEKEIEQINEDE